MSNDCFICGECPDIPRRCNHCNEPVCEDHALPEHHDCAGLRIPASETKRFESTGPDTGTTTTTWTPPRRRTATDRDVNRPTPKASEPDTAAVEPPSDTVDEQADAPAYGRSQTSPAGASSDTHVSLQAVRAALPSPVVTLATMVLRPLSDLARIAGAALLYVGVGWLCFDVLRASFAGASPLTAVVGAIALRPVVFGLAGAALVWATQQWR